MAYSLFLGRKIQWTVGFVLLVFGTLGDLTLAAKEDEPQKNKKNDSVQTTPAPTRSPTQSPVASTVAPSTSVPSSRSPTRFPTVKSPRSPPPSSAAATSHQPTQKPPTSTTSVVVISPATEPTEIVQEYPSDMPTFEPANGPSQELNVVSVSLPEMAVSFDLKPGTPIDQVLVQNLFEQFLRQVLTGNSGPLALHFETKIKYQSLSGWGTVVIDGNWKGNKENKPSEATYIGVLMYWGIEDLDNQMRSIGYPMERMEVTVNGKLVQIDDLDSSLNQGDGKSTGGDTSLMAALILCLILFLGISLLVVLLVIRRRVEHAKNDAKTKAIANTTLNTTQGSDDESPQSYQVNRVLAVAPVPVALEMEAGSVGGRSFFASDQTAVSLLPPPSDISSRCDDPSLFTSDNAATVPIMPPLSLSSCHSRSPSLNEDPSSMWSEGHSVALSKVEPNSTSAGTTNFITHQLSETQDVGSLPKKNGSSTIIEHKEVSPNPNTVAARSDVFEDSSIVDSGPPRDTLPTNELNGKYIIKSSTNAEGKIPAIV